MNTTLKALFHLIKCALTDDRTPLESDIDWNSLFRIAHSHQITVLIYQGIQNLGISLEEKVKQKFQETVFKHTIVDAERDYETKRLLQAFEKAGIDYAPLKGLVVRDFYPSAEMRTLGDIDILIKEGSVEKASDILKSLGFSFDLESSHELKWHKGQVVVLELHKKFIGNGIPKYYDYYKNVDKYLIKSALSHRMEMSYCDLIVYLTVHIAKHYINGGIGMRHFIDLYILGILNKNDKEDYILNELSTLGLDGFYKSIKRLLLCWFDGAKFDETSALMTRKIVVSGTFGNSNSRFVANTAKTSRNTVLKTAVFLPFALMAKKYPVLNKLPFLLPFFWIVRIVNIIFRKQDKLRLYSKRMKMVSNDALKKYNEELKLVGIK